MQKNQNLENISDKRFAQAIIGDCINMVELYGFGSTLAVIPAVNLTMFEDFVGAYLTRTHPLAATYRKMSDGWLFNFYTDGTVDLEEVMQHIDEAEDTKLQDNKITFIIRDTYELFPFTIRA